MILTLTHRPSNVLRGVRKKRAEIKSDSLEQQNFQNGTLEQQNSSANDDRETDRSLPRCPQNCHYLRHIFVDTNSVWIFICIFVCVSGNTCAQIDTKSVFICNFVCVSGNTKITSLPR